MQTIELRSQVQGKVILPGDVDYDAERTGWNLAVDHHPAAIVVASSADDIAAAVRYAASMDMPLAVKATGHGPSIAADGAVLISTQRLDGLMIDTSSSTARIGAGVRWSRVIAEAAPHGLAPLIGSSPNVSATGYLTGGGLPVIGRTYGFAADRVRSFEIVTADGDQRRVTAADEPDLFWAVRGGKDNFGIVTAMETDLLPLEQFYAGALVFPGAATGEVLGGWVSWTSDLPDEMNSSLSLLRVPDAPGVPEAMRGQFLIQVFIAYTGERAEGERLMRPLRTLGPIQDTVAVTPFSRIGQILGGPTDPIPVRDRGILLRQLDAGAVERLTELVGPGAKRPPLVTELRHLGGALGRPPRSPNAVGPRDAAYSLLVGSITQPDRDAQLRADQQDVIDGLREWDARETLPSLLGSGATHPDAVRAAYRAADYERLMAIKATYDPSNLFRINHNIPPAS